MGFDAETIYNLTFEDGKLSGLEVRAAAPTLGDTLKLAPLAKFEHQQVGPEDLPTVMPAFEVFAASLIDWNLERRGKPVPATYDGLLQLDPSLAMLLIDAWMRAFVHVATPLAMPSSGGGTSAVPPLPMEALSPSQAS